MSEKLAQDQHDSLEDVAEPSETPGIVGHLAQTAALVAAHRDGKLHHGLLFAGPRGVGKATVAFRLAEYLLSGSDRQSLDGDPASALFRMIASGAHPGVLHLTRPYDDKGKKFRTQITADEIKRVNRFLGMTAHDGGHRIVIVDPADDMNRHAANALLKNLEEPPRNTLFILIAHQPGGLLPTIRSRCQIVRFEPLGNDELAQVLAAANEQAPSQALLTASGGSAREALLLSRHGGMEIAETVGRIVGDARFDVALAYKLADAVTARDQTIQFGLFNQAILDRLSERAVEAAGRHVANRAASYAEAWREAERAIAETEAYNLDRRHHVVSLLRAAQEALRA